MKLCPSGGFARKYIHMFTNIVLICICFLKKTLPKRRFCPKTCSYVHKYCAHMYIFSKGNSVQAEVLLKNISICSQIYVHMYMFLKETLPKRMFRFKTYSYVHKIYVHMCIFYGETLYV
ncbi:hypothetical protein Taro_047797, partial [Colocasia esculenta]|nr:hypothetical protein [Colocasia esculenta]